MEWSGRLTGCFRCDDDNNDDDDAWLSGGRRTDPALGRGGSTALWSRCACAGGVLNVDVDV